ncbi:uncharacterized protein TNCV_1712711 [Trichonephila clavipes]|nr:uncharacterized protein TNCV_1712711 [Trichonephila clavipes]
MVPGKLWSSHARVTTNREDHRLQHMAGEHDTVSTAKIKSWLEIYANLQSPKTPMSISYKVPYRFVTNDICDLSDVTLKIIGEWSGDVLCSSIKADSVLVRLPQQVNACKQPFCGLDILGLNLELWSIADELKLVVPDNAKVLDLRELIQESEIYKNDKETYQAIVDCVLEEINDRRNEDENRRNENENRLEIEKIKLSHVKTCCAKNCFCGKPHNRLIHFPKPGKESVTLNQTVQRSVLNPLADVFGGPGGSNCVVPPQGENEENKSFVATSFLKNKTRTVLLSSVQCFLRDKYGLLHEVRALLDVGSAEIFYELLRPGQIYCGDSRLLLQNTVFGYVVSGSVGDEVRNNNIHCGLIRDSDLNTTLRSFWELESTGVKNENCSSEEDVSFEMFKQRVHFKNGRYEVELPWKRDSNELSDNFSLAKRRLGSLMRKKQRDKVLYSEYCKVLKNYLDVGIIEKVTNPFIPTNNPVFYLPHQGIIKNESLTTKLRLVFDASAHEEKQLSLNVLTPA